MFKVGEYQFTILEHPTATFPEVSHWLNANYFNQFIEIFDLKQIRTLQQLVQQITRSDLD
jgi:hypothetical protein